VLPAATPPPPPPRVLFADRAARPGSYPRRQQLALETLHTGVAQIRGHKDQVAMGSGRQWSHRAGGRGDDRPW
jgi:hypothetical protein